MRFLEFTILYFYDRERGHIHIITRGLVEGAMISGFDGFQNNDTKENLRAVFEEKTTKRFSRAKK